MSAVGDDMAGRRPYAGYRTHDKSMAKRSNMVAKCVEDPWPPGRRGEEVCDATSRQRHQVYVAGSEELGGDGSYKRCWRSVEEEGAGVGVQRGRMGAWAHGPKGPVT